MSIKEKHFILKMYLNLLILVLFQGKIKEDRFLHSDKECLQEYLSSFPLNDEILNSFLLT